MATNDFTTDLVDKLTEENIEYLVITVQKGKDEHKSNAYFNISTVDGLDMIATTVDHVFQNLADDTDGGSSHLELPDDSDSDYKEGSD
jgi:hypothetical protein